MKVQIFIVIAFIIGALSMLIWIASDVHYPDDVDQQTKEQCREFADRDHEKLFAPERWAKEKEMITSFDWYTSCINHVKYPVAR